MCRYQLQEGKTESFRTLHKALSEAEFSLLTETVGCPLFTGASTALLFGNSSLLLIKMEAV